MTQFLATINGFDVLVAVFCFALGWWTRGGEHGED